MQNVVIGQYCHLDERSLSLLKIIRQIEIHMLRCYSLHVSTDGVNGHAKCLLSALSDLFNCVISFIFLVHLNTMCCSSDALENGNVEPETIQR